MKPLITALGLAALLATPASADISVGVGLTVTGDAEIRSALYDCTGSDTPLAVRYINAAPDFLALVPIDGKPQIFVNVISASGAKYESGQYVWWNKGVDATLHDVTEGIDAAPVLTCTEQINTP